MNGDDFRDARAGDPLVISARWRNEVNRVVRDYRASQRNSRGGDVGSDGDPAVLAVMNNSDEVIPRFGVLAIDTPVNDPATIPQAYQNDLIFNAVKPQDPAHVGKFGIAVRPIAKNRVGLLVMVGITRVKLNVQNEGDTFADVLDGSTTNLKTGTSGLASILYKQSGTGADKWALVRLGGSGGLPVPEELSMVLQATAQNVLGADFVRAHEMEDGDEG